MTKKVVVIDTEGDGLSHDATTFHVMGWTYDGEKIDTTHSEFRMKCLLEEWYRDDYKIIIHNALRHDVALFMRLLHVHLPVSSYVDTLALSWTINHDRIKHGLGEYGEEFGVPKPDVEFWTIQDGQTEEEFQEIMRDRVTEDVKINWILWKQLEGKLGEFMEKTDIVDLGNKITRVEVIDNNGRAYVNYDPGDVQIMYQDGGRTIKIFLGNLTGETIDGKSYK